MSAFGKSRYTGDRHGRTTAKRFDNEELLDLEAEEFGRRLHRGAFGKGKRALNVDAETTNGVLDPPCRDAQETLRRGNSGISTSLLANLVAPEIP